jgi:superfamily II DNA or RNA helicase
MKLRYNNCNAYLTEYEGNDKEKIAQEEEETKNLMHALSYPVKGSRFFVVQTCMRCGSRVSKDLECPECGPILESMVKKGRLGAEITRTVYSERYKYFSAGLIPYLQSKKFKRKLEDGTFETYAFDNLELEDARPYCPPPLMNEINLWNEDEKQPYILDAGQLKAVDLCIEKERGTCRLSTGAGKTVIGMALTQRIGLTTLFLVHTKTLLHQTAKKFKSSLRISNVGIIGDDIWEPATGITVALVDTLYSRIKNQETLKFLAKQEVMIVDEVQHASKKYKTVEKQCKRARYRIGLSATAFMNKDKKRTLDICAITGPLIFEVEMDTLVKNKRLAKPHAFFIEIPDDGNCWELLDWPNLYDEGIVNYPLRNMIFAYVAYTMRSRGYNSLALVERLQHGENLKNEILKLDSNINIRYITGEEKSQQAREDAISDIQTGVLDTLITSRIFNEGVDMPMLESVIVCAGFKDVGLTYQRYGRGVRRKGDKKEAFIFDGYDQFSFKLRGHSDERLSMCMKNKAFHVEKISFDDIDSVLDHYLTKGK